MCVSVDFFELADGTRIGLADLETRNTLFSLPKRDDRIQVFSAEVALARKTLRRGYWVFDLNTAALISAGSVVMACLDLDARRTEVCGWLHQRLPLLQVDRAALADIKDATETKPYVIDIEPGVYDIADSFREGKREVELGIKPAAVSSRWCTGQGLRRAVQGVADLNLFQAAFNLR